MKRTFPNKTKSVGKCELHTEASIEQTKQTNIDTSKACSSAAMIGLAAISTTMGASGILFPGEGDRAVAAELPQIDTNQQYSSEVKISELNITGVNRGKGLLLQKLTQGHVNTEGNSDSEVGITKPETVLPSGQQLGDRSFLPVELKQKNLNQAKSNKLPPLGSISKVQVKKDISSDGLQLEQLKTGINPVQKQKNRPAKSSVEWRYEESVSESVGKPFDLSKRKILEKNISQKPQNLVVTEPALEIATPKLDNNSAARQVTEDRADISPESIKTQETKLEGAVVIDSEMTSTPVSLVYKVRVGDTLSLIASQHNVSVGSLAKINQIKDPDVIEVAKLLKIPQQKSSSSLTLPTYKGGNFTYLENYSGKQEFGQASQETKNDRLNFPETKIPIKKSDYSSYNKLNLPTSKVSTMGSLELTSWSQDAGNKESQINQKSKEFITSKHSVATQKTKTPLVNGKVWPTHLKSNVSRPNSTTELENQINFTNNQPVQQTEIASDTKDSESVPVAQTDNKENPYSNRLRSEITRLREEYNAQKDLEESQSTNSQSTTIIPVPQPLSSENNLSINHQIPINNNNKNRYLQRTYQLEISTPETRQWSEEMRNNRPERRNPATVVKELPAGSQINQSQDSSLMVAAPIGGNADQILNNPSLGKMVSPDLPPLGKADTYLPGGSMQFTGYTWPARGALTSGYGWRWGRMHRGIDIAAPTGTPIVAAAPGIVTYADWNSGGYGNLVEIQHPNGSLTVYAHNSQILVREGQKVSQGEMIAKMGSTGRSTGPHLHFEIHPKGNGAVNPMALLPSGRTYN
ncbi:MAG: peptidoglycan DD-metalloendopeptidase family protein [Okeania sp. SIO3I5]|uniref:peptidoglycan DD-metalloendopeptidase family protein n=1 Tax=Okeania sp. SIO3I5 TaxID=2607805 RepID=UPI0013B95414|nr:peptidoglycan DD-metalloendopeptidase family protein [Okeania sp. SIO3I5]NEQ36080.1 peptidoglycan DD-metalloendopeptidase family protein [Okeania sp. SIO3I5]